MNESRAAIRYAKALLDLAIDNKATEAVEKDMRSVVDTIADSADLQVMLVSPVIDGEAKKKALVSVFKGGDSLTEKLFSLLTANKRIALLNDVAKKYILLNEALKGQNVAYVTTAVPLTGDLEKKILAQVAKLTGKDVTVKNQIDESILGGFVLRVGDLQYDASIANKLSGLKREFTNSL
ncbi:MAG: ATP synthase F1 subunit delta [Cellulophaga sp.]